MEAVIFTGIQGAGKSTFFKKRFFDTHVRINLDMLRTRHRELLLLQACIAAKQPFVVDNTNVTREHRSRYLIPAKEAGFRVVGYFFDVDPQSSARRNAQRSGKKRVPLKALYGTYHQLVPPCYDEGFDELFRVTIEDGHFAVTSIARA